jgi:3-hydroxyisobutyrate dehydrogenase-like beta-hydroxyacid dehydrogenase
MKIGVIGLGHMGNAIASRLLAAGHEITVYNRTQGKAEELMRQGATVAEDLASAAAGDAVITMLADDRAVEQVVLGTRNHQGLIDHQEPQTIHISMSTISAMLSRRIEEASRAQGKLFVSAPVMGRPDVARKGELIVLTAGDSNAIEKCRPVFEAFAKAIHVVGQKPEQANTTKLAANFMISCMIETMSEAFALLRKNGIDHCLFLDVMAKEFFQSPVMAKYGNIITGEQFDTRAFTVRLQEKDTRLALDVALESQVPMPFAMAVENIFLAAIGRGKGNMDPCAISQIALENAGIDGNRNVLV